MFGGGRGSSCGSTITDRGVIGKSVCKQFRLVPLVWQIYHYKFGRLPSGPLKSESEQARVAEGTILFCHLHGLERATWP